MGHVDKWDKWEKWDKLDNWDKWAGRNKEIWWQCLCEGDMGKWDQWDR